jgi:hypothetical protein
MVWTPPTPRFKWLCLTPSADEYANQGKRQAVPLRTPRWSIESSGGGLAFFGIECHSGVLFNHWLTEAPQ